MELIANKVKEINRLRNHIVIALRIVLISQAEFIEELNRRQLERGERSDGSILPPYSPVSVSMGKPAGAIKLFDEGDFYEGITANVFDDELRFEGEDEKTPMLIAKYGRLILGLNDESLQLLINHIRPLLQKEVKRFYLTI